MTEAVVERRIVRISPVAALGSRFGRYAPEKERDARRTDVRKDKGLEGMYLFSGLKFPTIAFPQSIAAPSPGNSAP